MLHHHQYQLPAAVQQMYYHRNPTAENIVVVIYNILRPLIDNRLELKIKLYETERNYSEYPA